MKQHQTNKADSRSQETESLQKNKTSFLINQFSLVSCLLAHIFISLFPTIVTTVIVWQ